VLVNNAGIYPPDGTLSTDETTFDRVFAVNVKAPFFLTAALIPAMIEAGDGRVINLGSWIAHLGIPGRCRVRIDQGDDGDAHADLGGRVWRRRDPGECHLSRRRARQPHDLAAAAEAAMAQTPAGQPGHPADIAATAVPRPMIIGTQPRVLGLVVPPPRVPEPRADPTRSYR
jgi:short chain dehydrogenase